MISSNKQKEKEKKERKKGKEKKKRKERKKDDRRNQRGKNIQSKRAGKRHDYPGNKDTTTMIKKQLSKTTKETKTF